MTLKTLELLALVQSLSNSSDFEFPTGPPFSDFGSRIMLQTQLAGIKKATPGLRGLSGPAGGADFFGFACQNRDFLTIL